jgi:hypothetical protein
LKKLAELILIHTVNWLFHYWRKLRNEVYKVSGKVRMSL